MFCLRNRDKEVIMSEEEPDISWASCRIILIFVLISVTGEIVAGVSPETDREVLLQLKDFLKIHNKVNQGRYVEWNETNRPLCNWPGISCDADGRVTGVNLSCSSIAGPIFQNFSALANLTYLDLSKNAINGEIPSDLNLCTNLKYLNLSHNLIEGHLNISGLNRLVTLDLTLNRFHGGIQWNFPAICRNGLRTLNLSTNNFSGQILDVFDECHSLQTVDLSSNKFEGPIWPGLARLREFYVSENNLTGKISPEIFSNCTLEDLDLSENQFGGEFPGSVSNCKGLTSLNIAGNQFSGNITPEIGSLPELTELYLGKNRFSREIPESLLNCTKLLFLDLSKNNFGGDIQEILGRFVQLRFLVLHGNNYIGGIIESGILKLAGLVRLDLSFNNFSGELPIEISEMNSLRLLILAYNNFSGHIPAAYGKLSALQSLDLSFNRLTGSIPRTIGNLTSLLWLMLANNSLTGEIPREIGNCSSLLWLNLADNQLAGKIPAEISTIGSNPQPTFESNRRQIRIMAASGECLAMKRWIPATYPPFSFAYILLNRKSCRSLWDRLLKGYSIFPICRNSSDVRSFVISGYLQLTGNKFSGEIPPEIGRMQNFSLLQLGSNAFSGNLPHELAKMPLVVLNVSSNGFSGKIPEELGDIKCLQNLDLSSNNFSGNFPTSLNQLSELNKFNASFNPLLTGTVPATGQLSTLENDAFLGNPLIVFANRAPTAESPAHVSSSRKHGKKTGRVVAFAVFLTLTLAFLVCGIVSLYVCHSAKNRTDSVVFLSDSKRSHDLESSPGHSSTENSDPIKVFRLVKIAFTYEDIVTATGNFSEDKIVGKGGFGTVYQGVLPDGREVAVKKLQREGLEGEREFRAEMEVLSGNGVGWPHPNLVPLYGWCLFRSEKLLVYEFMGGGTLEELLSDWTRLGWRRRVESAVDVARALAFLHHECNPSVVHRDVKASNVLLDKEGRARVTDFGLARMVGPGDSHVSTIVAGTVGYVAPEYFHTWRATTKGDVYSFGVLAMELATGRRALDGGDECLVDWVRRVAGGLHKGLRGAVVPVMMSGMEPSEDAEMDKMEGLRETCELLRVGIRCTAEAPNARPDMKEVLEMLLRICR